jgi:hypothetical protein
VGVQLPPRPPREISASAGLSVIWAATTVVDNLFDDLQSLQESGAGSVADAKDAVFFVLDDLPDRYRHRYDELFVRKFLVANRKSAERCIRGRGRSLTAC